MEAGREEIRSDFQKKNPEKFEKLSKQNFCFRINVPIELKKETVVKGEMMRDYSVKIVWIYILYVQKIRQLRDKLILENNKENKFDLGLGKSEKTVEHKGPFTPSTLPSKGRYFVNVFQSERIPSKISKDRKALPSFSLDSFGVEIEGCQTVIYLNIIIHPEVLKEGNHKATPFLLKMSGYALEREYHGLFIEKGEYFRFVMQKNGIRLMSKCKAQKLDRDCFPVEATHLQPKFWFEQKSQDKSKGLQKSQNEIRFSGFDSVDLKHSGLDESTTSLPESLDSGIGQTQARQNSPETKKKIVMIEEIGTDCDKYELSERTRKNGDLILNFDFEETDFCPQELGVEVKQRWAQINLKMLYYRDIL